MDPRTPLIFPGGVCFFDCRRAGRHLQLQAASGILSFADSDATAVSPWRPFHNFLPFWTPHSRPNGVRFPPPSLFGRHYRFLMASDSQRPAILDAASNLTWRPFPNSPQFWTLHSRPPGVRLIRICDFGRLSHFPVASVPHLSTILDATSDAIVRGDVLILKWTPPSDATITDATSASPWRPFPKVASRRPNTASTTMHF